MASASILLGSTACGGSDGDADGAGGGVALECGKWSSVHDAFSTWSVMHVNREDDVYHLEAYSGMDRVLLRSRDRGAHWQSLDFWSTEGGTSVSGMQSDSKGTLYVTGQAIDSDNYQFVVASPDRGKSWKLVDTVSQPGRNCGGLGLAVAADDSVYALGRCIDPSAAGFEGYRFVVRRSQPGGTTWSTLPEGPVTPAYDANIFVYESDRVLVATQGKTYELDSNGTGWVTVANEAIAAQMGLRFYAASEAQQGNAYTLSWRRATSLDGPWESLDTLELVASEPGFAKFAALQDRGDGTLMALAHVSTVWMGDSYLVRTVTRLSTNDGASWQTVAEDDDMRGSLVADSTGAFYSLLPRVGIQKWPCP